MDRKPTQCASCPYILPRGMERCSFCIEAEPPFHPTTSHPTPETIDTMAQERLAPLECWIDDLADAGAFRGGR